MLKLRKYLRPFAALIVLALILLFSQGMCDLTLPAFMANIVNTGLQNAGIETTAADELSEGAFSLILLSSDEADAKVISKSYSSEGGRYILNTQGKSNRSELDGAISRASLTLSMFSGVSLEADFPSLYLLDLSPSPALSAAQIESRQAQDNVLSQAGVSFIRGMYKELGIDPSKVQMDYIFKNGGIMLLISLLGISCAVGVGFLSSRISSSVAKNLRRDIFRKVESFSNSEFDEFSTASLITRTTNDVTQIQMVIFLGIRMMCYAPIMGIGGIIMVVSKSVSMTWTIALSVSALLLMIITIYRIVLPKFKIIQKLIDKLNLVSRENLTGVMVTRAFGAREFERRRFGDANADLTKTSLFINRVMVFMMPAMMLIMNLTMLLIVWAGAGQIQAGALMVGDMMAFLQYAMHIIMSFFIISMMFIMVPRASVSGDRIYEVLSTDPSITDPEFGADFDPKKDGVVEFKNVSFRYGGAKEDVLRDISFTANPGSTTAIIGATGSGKSTLVNLIPRFYDVTGGEVIVGGVNVKDTLQSDLRRKIGFVPQKGVLISGTIESNLRYAKSDITEEEIRRSLEISQSSQFVSQKEGGISSEVSQGGSNVSGGQRQRLSIARAILRDAAIYIFDDSFSALDFETDAKLRAALKPHTKNATVIIVAQRVSTIMNAEQILVLDEGRLIGCGTHDELLGSCSVYREIAASQLGVEVV